MEIIIKGFNDWVIDTAHDEKGKQWAEIWKRDKEDWYQFSAHDTLDEALGNLLENGLRMTEDEVCQEQESCY